MIIQPKIKEKNLIWTKYEKRPAIKNIIPSDAIRAFNTNINSEKKVSSMKSKIKGMILAIIESNHPKIK